VTTLIPTPADAATLASRRPGQAQGVVRLADSLDAERLDVACGRALAADGSLRTVRTILTKGLDRDAAHEA
jgi:hypothetical protein